jgi:putative ABC transport system permease protein
MPLARLRSLLRNIFRRERIERDLDAEVRSLSDFLREEKISQGMNPSDARRAAQTELGGSEQLKEEIRAARKGSWLESLWQDVCFAARLLRKNPGFTAVAVLTLALGIGPNTAMFSVLNAVLLRPLPYPHPERLVVLQETSPDNRELSVSFPDYQDWRKQQTVFDHLALFRRSGLTLTGKGQPERLSGAKASADLFQIFNLTPMLGRVFSDDEDRPGSAPSVILSYGLWQRLFGGDSLIVGKTIILNSIPHTVVGVLPDVAAIPRNAELWTSLGPLAATPELNRRSNHMGFTALGQLKSGTSVDEARSEMKNISLQLGKQFPDTNTGEGVALTPILDTMVGEYRHGLFLLAGAVGLVLLIACANLANLLLAKGAARQREFVMRSALGAPRTRIIRQLLTESAILALLGGGLGVLLAYWAKGAILALAPAGAARFQETQIDGNVLLFALALSLFTGVLFGSLPAWKRSRTNLREVMQDGYRGVSDGSAKRRLRRTLVTGEVALTLVLLISAGLLLQSLMRLESVNLGFDPTNILMTIVDLSPARYSDDGKVNAFYDKLLSRIRALPGVRGATLDSAPPLDTGWETGFDVEGRPPFPQGKGPSAEISIIDSDYFHMMGIPLFRGRSFGPQDTHDGTPSVIIDEAFAHRI